MSATQQRDQAARLAGIDMVSALRVAWSIDDPWFRCQALSHVARHMADQKRFMDLIAESLKSGWSITDPNRSVSVIAWPVAALASRNDSDPDEMKRTTGMLREIIARLTKVIAKEPNPASRADALMLHVHALTPSRRELRKAVLSLFVKECRDPANRKRQRQIEEAALAIAPDDPDAAMCLVKLLDRNRMHHTAERIEAHWQGLGARQFFSL